jgi:hypothetical protein
LVTAFCDKAIGESTAAVNKNNNGFFMVYLTITRVLLEKKFD